MLMYAQEQSDVIMGNVMLIYANIMRRHSDEMIKFDVTVTVASWAESTHQLFSVTMIFKKVSIMVVEIDTC